MQRNIFLRCFGWMALVGVILTNMACNTTEGVGKDIEDGGDAIKDAARDAKN